MSSVVATNATSELLRTIADVLDIRNVFPRVSEIVNRAVPHDALALACVDRSGCVTLAAVSTKDFPGRDWCASTDDEAVSVVSDLRSVGSGLAAHHMDTADLLAAGYRSILSVRCTTQSQSLRLGFFSKEPATYSLEDVDAAQSIAACLRVAVAHHHLADAQRDEADARGRCSQTDVRVNELADKGQPLSGHGRVIGGSSRWQRVLAQALRVAPTDATVFLQGESGTGKEVVARFIHQASPRKHGPFIAINCAALPEQLLEAELFGYERGAFTGAHQTKIGQVELAAKGVLFLDEVSEMSRAAQAKLLRFLQEREFQRLGGTRLQKAHVRVVAASNRDLRQAVQQGDFREDLFYRLQVFDIQLPALRERIGDVPLLAERFVEEFCAAFGRPLLRLTEDARDALLAHDWPGNVRELRNVIERAVILSEGRSLDSRHFSLIAAPARLPRNLPAMESEAIARVMQETDGNKAKAARRLGITRTQLYVRLRKYAVTTLPPVDCGR